MNELETIAAVEALYADTLSHGVMRRYRYGEVEFPYALVDSERVPDGVSEGAFGFKSEGITDGEYLAVMMDGQTHGMTPGNPQSTKAYRSLLDRGKAGILVRREVPEEFQGILATHEFVEIYVRFFTANQNYAHTLGSKAEFHEAERQGDDMLRRYVRYYLEMRPELQGLPAEQLEYFRKLLPARAVEIFREEGFPTVFTK